ncbi:unnamed protein product [Cuscuta campestris]|uniref:Uncharacterized protein n=1 Tax=Cuscuta campestris TaxID=132261 RepID=A0A484KL22_9ASTE|nr:unnamed protein product [Cuscuta campestris]
MFRSVGLAAESPHLGAATVCYGCRRETDAAGKTLAHCSAVLPSPLSPRRYRLVPLLFVDYTASCALTELGFLNLPKV